MTRPITITTDAEIGPTLRTLRHNAGLTTRQLAAQTHLSPSGINKREHGHASRLGALLHHIHALGHVIALLPAEHPTRRNTGTGWPT